MRGPIPRTIVTARLALVAAVVAPLWLLPGRSGIVAGWIGLALLMLLAAIDWLLLPSARHVLVERELASTVGIGDSIDGAYVVRSRWPRPLVMQLVHEPPAGVKAAMTDAPVALPAGGTVRIPLALTGAVRGRHPLGQVGVRVQSPLGLLAARLRFAPDDEITVMPSLSGVRRFRLLALQHRLHVAGVRTLRQRGEGASIAGLREYAIGDDPRRVDWKATARRDRLVVREYQVEQSQTVFTLIDAGRLMTQLAGDYSRFEHALSAALVLTDVAAGSGDRVGTLAFDDEVRAFSPAQRGTAALRSVRDALVSVMPTMTEPDYAAAFRHLATRQRRRALIVFFTDVIDARSSRALLAYVSRGAARHLVVVVALRNDAIFAAAAPKSSSAQSLYESAAAEELIMAREEALERMRRSGVTVLDVSPHTMTAAVVNRYLELKGRGAV